jgi:signal transduction histidine kinase/ActR/RegA family two-component response regulator
VPRPLAALFDLAARLTDPARRTEVARAQAAQAGAEDLIIFIADAEVGAMLPAPGFRQTLPDARRWQGFVREAAAGRSPVVGGLPHPEHRADVAALGLAGSDGSVLVLMGGRPVAGTAESIAAILPVLAAAFRGEHAVRAAEGHAAVARASAGQARLLAASLDSARAALQKALAEAEAANRAKDQFLAVLSHELRTPLAPVLTTVTLLLAEPGLPGELRSALEVIRRNVELEARLIDDLLDLTRVAKGKMPLSLATVDVHASVRQTLDICRSDIYRKGLEVGLDLAADERHVRADPVRLQQVLWNLVKNAVKFTPAGGGLAIRSGNEGRRVRIEVSDTGIGIDASHVGRIFEAFEQTGDGVTHRFGGLGLGLAISKALVEAQGGTVVATSPGAGKGSTFTVTLPTVPPPDVIREVKPGAREAREARPLRLMLVEDHRDTAMVMTRLLRDLGHEVDAADCVGAALELARQKPFDLVLSDLGLPDGSGLDLMRELADRFGLPGVAISGYGMEDDLARSKEVGFVAHLTKPVNLQQVQAVLAQFAGEHPRRK